MTDHIRFAKRAPPKGFRAGAGMGEYRALDTHYRGYRFRSRLEARWAVAFDHAGLAYEYEPQGFLIDGTPYLPDFLLPGIGYFEVKGIADYPSALYQAFAEATNTFLFVAAGGIPDPESFHAYLEPFGPRGNIDAELHPRFDLNRPAMFLECTACREIDVWDECYCTAKGVHGFRCDNERARLMPLRDAFKAARSARFEHGECGA